MAHIINFYFCSTESQLSKKKTLERSVLPDLLNQNAYACAVRESNPVPFVLPTTVLTKYTIPTSYLTVECTSSIMTVWTTNMELMRVKF